jgi:hypothetical protein
VEARANEGDSNIYLLVCFRFFFGARAGDAARLLQLAVPPATSNQTNAGKFHHPSNSFYSLAFFKAFCLAHRGPGIINK